MNHHSQSLTSRPTAHSTSTYNRYNHIIPSSLPVAATTHQPPTSSLFVAPGHTRPLNPRQFSKIPDPKMAVVAFQAGNNDGMTMVGGSGEAQKKTGMTHKISGAFQGAATRFGKFMGINESNMDIWATATMNPSFDPRPNTASQLQPPHKNN